MNNTTTQILDPSTVLIHSVDMKTANEHHFILWQDGGMTLAHATTDAAGNDIVEEQLLCADQIRALRNFLNSQVARETLGIK